MAADNKYFTQKNIITVETKRRSQCPPQNEQEMVALMIQLASLSRWDSLDWITKKLHSSIAKIHVRL